MTEQHTIKPTMLLHTAATLAALSHGASSPPEPTDLSNVPWCGRKDKGGGRRSKNARHIAAQKGGKAARRKAEKSARRRNRK